LTQPATTNAVTDPTAPVGSEANPIPVRVTEPAPDPADVAMANLTVAADHHLGEFSRNADFSANLDPATRQLVNEASSAVRRVIGIADVAAAQAAGYLRDDTMFPAGRERLARETADRAQSDIAAAFEEADVRLEIAQASLYEAARPTMPKDESGTARQDAIMILDGAQSGGPRALVDAVRQLASREDAVGALVAGPWLSDYMAARGIDADLRPAVVNAVRAAVVDVAARSGDPKRSAAGRTSQAITSVRKARVAASTYTRLKLGR
jgi:hypothetical protein